MKHLEKICLSCQYFRPKSVDAGVCRLQRSLFPDYPVKGFTENCEEWKTSGQQYYIRVGWLRRQRELLGQEEGEGAAAVKA